MIVDTVFQPTRFAALSPGTFFKVVRDQEQFFCLAGINSRGELCALVFTQSPGQAGAPWYSSGDFAGAILAMPDAFIRPDNDTMRADDGAIPLGAIISDSAGNYIKVSAGFGNTMTFDIGTGTRVGLQEHDGSPVIYPRWSVGFVVDGKFEMAFRFPLAVPT